jgi:hypothetical protein
VKESDQNAPHINLALVESVTVSAYWVLFRIKERQPIASRIIEYCPVKSMHKRFQSHHVCTT